MSFDGMVTGSIACQLKDCLVGGKIEKIYQPEADEIVIHIHSGKEKLKLYISSNSSHARIHLITSTDANPQNPMGFCMLLRKHLQGGRITSIQQKDSERLIELFIDTVNELGFSVNKKLIVEIMGKHSNIILVDVVSNRIIDSIKRISIDVNRYRQILPGQQYVYPPSQNKISYYELTESAMEMFMENRENDQAKALLDHIQGISPAIAEEIVYQAGLIAREKSGFHDIPDTNALYSVLSSFVKSIRHGEITPRVYLDPDKVPVDFHLFPLSSLESSCEVQVFATICEAVDFYYSHKSSSNRIKQKSMDLVRAIGNRLDKFYLKKQRLSEDLLRAENSDIFRVYGELLTANIYRINQGESAVTVQNYYDGQNLTIPLEPRLSPSQNAQKYFKKYSKAKTAITEKKIQLNETNDDLAYLESVLAYIEQATSIDEIEELRQELTEGGFLKKRKNNYKPSKSKPAPYRYLTSDGFKVMVGRNNKENDLLTFKTASGKDIWFHTKDIPGSHVILFTEGRRVTENALAEAAGLAAYYSKARASENVPVDYTQVRHVKKPSGAKPGMVIFVDNKTLYVNPALINEEMKN